MIEIGPFRTADLEDVAAQLIDVAGSVRVWTFYGEMGAGKTTLIKAICEALGVGDDMSSPTFSIVNEYNSGDNGPIYHFDFYRIKEETEAIDIGVEDYFYSNNYCFVEWPERVGNLLPETHLRINIIFVDEITRMIRLNRPESGES